MPEEQPRASEKFRFFLDGEEILGGLITITVGPVDGMLCTLGGKVMEILDVVYDPSSGEIDEFHLVEVQE